MTGLFRKSIGNIRLVKLVYDALENTEDRAEDICNVAYNLQQAYEKLLKAYLKATEGHFARTHDIMQLYESAGVVDSTIAKYANKLTAWEASVWYAEIDVDEEEATYCYDYYWTAFQKYYNAAKVQSARVDRILTILRLPLSYSDLKVYLPEALPKDESELNSIVKEAVKKYYENTGRS